MNQLGFKRAAATHLLIIWLALVATACSQLPQRAEVPLWAFEGKFAWRSDAQNQTGYLRWQQYSNNFELTLWGTLGLGTTKISGTAKRISVDDGNSISHYNAADLVEILPGVLLPLAAFITSAQNLPSQHQLSVIRPIGSSGQWFSETLKADSTPDGLRPSKLQIYDTQDNTLIILIKQWL